MAIPTSFDLARLDHAIITGMQGIINGKRVSSSSKESRWWTGKQKSYTFEDGVTHNFWSGHRKYGYVVIHPYQVDRSGNITQPVEVNILDLGNWNDCQGDHASWWRPIPEELLVDP